MKMTMFGYEVKTKLGVLYCKIFKNCKGVARKLNRNLELVGYYCYRLEATRG